METGGYSVLVTYHINLAKCSLIITEYGSIEVTKNAIAVCESQA